MILIENGRDGRGWMGSRLGWGERVVDQYYVDKRRSDSHYRRVGNMYNKHTQEL